MVDNRQKRFWWFDTIVSVVNFSSVRKRQKREAKSTVSWLNSNAILANAQLCFSTLTKRESKTDCNVRVVWPEAHEYAVRVLCSEYSSSREFEWLKRSGIGERVIFVFLLSAFSVCVSGYSATRLCRDALHAFSVLRTQNRKPGNLLFVFC